MPAGARVRAGALPGISHGILRRRMRTPPLRHWRSLHTQPTGGPPPTHASRSAAVVVAPRHRCVIDQELGLATIQSFDASESTISLGGALRAARPLSPRRRPFIACQQTARTQQRRAPQCHRLADKSHNIMIIPASCLANRACRLTLVLHSVYGIDWFSWRVSFRSTRLHARARAIAAAPARRGSCAPLARMALWS